MMTDKPPSNGSDPLLLELLGRAAIKAGTENNDERMKAAGDRALAMAAKARREGKAGLIQDEDGTSVIVEK